MSNQLSKIYGAGLVERPVQWAPLRDLLGVDPFRNVRASYGFDYDVLTREPHARAADGSYHHDIVDALRDAGRALLSSEVLRPAGNAVDGRAKLRQQAMLGILQTRPIAGHKLGKSPYEIEQLAAYVDRARELFVQLGRVGDA